MVKIENVTFSYTKRKTLLSNLSLTLEAGRIHGLLGKNGEGKSTLLKLIAGLVFPKDGTIDTLNFNPVKRTPEMLREIYFIPEELPQLNMSIAEYENVYAPFYPNFSREDFTNYLKEFDIDDKSSKLTKQVVSVFTTKLTTGIL